MIRALRSGSSASNPATTNRAVPLRPGFWPFLSRAILTCLPPRPATGAWTADEAKTDVETVRGHLESSFGLSRDELEQSFSNASQWFLSRWRITARGNGAFRFERMLPAGAG